MYIVSTQSRAILLFEQAIKSDATRTNYLFHLNKFKEYNHLKDYDSIIITGKEKLQVMLEDYLFAKKKHLAPTSIRAVFYALQLFFSMNDVNLNFVKIKKMFPSFEKRAGSGAYSTDDIRKILDIVKLAKHRALIHVLASSGIRAGAITELRLMDLKEMPHGCKAMTVYANTKDEYTTFLTPEASMILEKYLQERQEKGEYLTPESPLFRKDTNQVFIGQSKPMTEGSVSKTLSQLVRRVKTSRKKQTDRRFTIQSAHGFRKRFNTILKSNNSVNPSLAEKMMGHSQTIQLDNAYFDPSVERLFEEFVRVIPELCIDESYKLRIENEAKQKKIEILDKQKCSDSRCHGVGLLPPRF